jgi:Protein of unknown function (DUF3592)
MGQAPLILSSRKRTLSGNRFGSTWDTSEPWGAGLSVAILIAAGGFFAWVAYLQVRISAEHRWPRVAGRIVESRLEWTGESYRAVISYFYTYVGERHAGNRIRSLMSDRTLGGSAQRIADQFPVGREVAVYVNPRDPRESVLEPGGEPRVVGALWLVAVVSLVSAALVAVA